MGNIVLFTQIFLAILLVGLILLQSKGTGFGRTFGGGGGTNFTRRGLEKVVFRFTFIVSFLFIIVSILQVTL
jgi:protein translocase SecG subunit